MSKTLKQIVEEYYIPLKLIFYKVENKRHLAEQILYREMGYKIQAKAEFSIELGSLEWQR